MRSDPPRYILDRILQLEHQSRERDRREFLLLGAILITLFLNLVSTYRLFVQ